MFAKTLVLCPVCDTTLGYAVRNEVCSFVCRECQWIFTWDRKGKLGKPIKLNFKKPDTCDCGSCRWRDENKYLKKPQG